MADIFHHFPINAPPEKVFEKISTGSGLESWWSKSTSGRPEVGAEYRFSFGPGYTWTAVVTRLEPGRQFELQFTQSDADWNGSRVGFKLSGKEGTTQVRFYHTGWKEDNEHYRVSNYCWAMYLRLLKRGLEAGEEVPYENRLDV